MYSLHNHSTYCDGNDSVSDMISAAANQKLQHFGLSGHSPLPFVNEWSIDSIEKAKEYCNEIKKGSILFPEINIYSALEADYIPGKSHSFSYLRNELKLDYIIGSVHLVKEGESLWFIDGPSQGYDDGIAKYFKGDIKVALKSYYMQINEMLEKEKFEILAHCDKVLMHNKNRFIKYEDPFHLNLLKESLCLAAEKGVIIEINTRGLYKGLHNDYYPGRYIFPFLKEKNISIMMSADGHKTNQITKGFNKLKNEIDYYGLKSIFSDTSGEPFIF